METWTFVLKLLNLSKDAREKFKGQKGRALAECEPFGTDIMGGSPSKEKNHVLYKVLITYPPNLFTKMTLRWVLPVWKD